jgi:hypothetical protein
MDRRFVSGVLLRCMIYSFILVLWWAAMILVGGDWVYRIQSVFFGLSRHEFDLINYCGIGLLKVFMFMAFVIPWLAIRFTAKSLTPPADS